MMLLRDAAQELVSGGLDGAIASFLTSLLPEGRPRRVARMYDPGGDDKYRDIPSGVELDRQKLLRHASGAETWAATLHRDDLARVGAADVDEATPQAGRTELLARYRDVWKAAVQAIAIYVENERGKHYGGHIFGFYREFCCSEAITAHWHAILPTVKEIWPCNQVIRLPFGYHRWAATRGELWYLTDDGELLTRRLDHPAELAEAFALTTSPLLLNDAPPPLSVTSISAPQPAPAACKITLGEWVAERLSVEEVISRFNREHSLADLLSQYGTEEVRPGYYSCPCGIPHTHTITLFISKRGKLFSLSPRCRWHTSKGWDSFGLYCLVEHGGDRVAALKTINPYPPRQHREQPPLPTMPEYLTPQATEARCRDRERKRQDRRAQTATALAAARERLNDGSLSSRAAKLLVVLLDLAGTSRQIYPTNIALAEVLGVCERTVQRAFRELELAGVGERHGGRFVPDNPSANTPAVWTFGRPEGDSAGMVSEPALTVSAQDREPPPRRAEDFSGSVPAQEADGRFGRSEDDSSAAEAGVPAVTLVDHTCDSISDSGTCERRPAAPPTAICQPEAWELWEHQPDLSDWTGPGDAPKPAIQPDSPPSLASSCLDRDRLTYARKLACELGGSALITDYAEMSETELEAAITSMESALAHVETPALEPGTLLAGPDGACCYPGGTAWLPTDRAATWWETLWKPAPTTADLEEGKEGQVASTTLINSPTDLSVDDAPAIQARRAPRWRPPTDPQLAKEYGKLLGKARKVQKTNPKQAAALRRKAQAMEELCYDEAVEQMTIDASPPRAHKLSIPSESIVQYTFFA